MAQQDAHDEFDGIDERPQRRKEHKRYGDGLIVLLFVVGVAAVIIGVTTKSVIALGVGVVLVVIGVIALVRPNRKSGVAQVWRCDACGWVFETEGRKRHTLVCTCPHCGEETTCTPLKR